MAFSMCNFTSWEDDFQVGFKGWVALPSVLSQVLQGESYHPLSARPARGHSSNATHTSTAKRAKI